MTRDTDEGTSFEDSVTRPLPLGAEIITRQRVQLDRLLTAKCRHQCLPSQKHPKGGCYQKRQHTPCRGCCPEEKKTGQPIDSMLASCDTLYTMSIHKPPKTMTHVLRRTIVESGRLFLD